MFLSLHNRSAYSFGSALTLPGQLVEAAASQGMSAVALTDRDGLYAAVPFQQACERSGVKPIFGAELSITTRRGEEGGRKARAASIAKATAEDAVSLTLIAQNLEGYGNLCRLISMRHLQDGGASLHDVATFSNGLICLVGAMPLPANGRRGDNATAAVTGFRSGTRSAASLAGVDPLAELHAIFADRLYVEIAIHHADDAAVARRRARLADERGIQLVATCESRCLHREQNDTLRALASIGTLTLIDQPHADKPIGAWHFRTAAEMERLFARRPDALANTHKIAEQCNVRLELGRSRFPSYDAIDGRPAAKVLRDLAVAGCRRRYVELPQQKGIGGRRPTYDEAIERLDREMSIIEHVHYAEYFLVFHEIAEYCRREGISFLARGSAADSLVCYALGVSHACPFRFDLPFDRFINPERAKFSKMADIDLDLPWDRRDQVINWVYERWGHDRVAMIGSPNTFHARAAVADLGRVHGLPPHEVHQATKLMPHVTAWNIPRALARSPEARGLPIDEEPYRTILNMARELDGLPRHWSMHPCGLVVSPEPLTELVPVQRSPKGPLVAQYDMDAIEDLGFVKIDLLGQAGLSVLRDAVEEIHRTEGTRVDLEWDVDYSEPQTWEMIARGDARGVHHIESPAMTSLIRQCNCRDIDCLTAIVAVIRPGAANQGKKDAFARRYQGLEPPTYPHPSLQGVLETTYGLMVFEEHILQVATEFGGMNLGRADVLRRALNKENRVMIAELKSEFYASAILAGRRPSEIDAVWPLLEGFAGFMFNKAHSAEYAVEAFQGAWLKRRWPAHYLAAILSNYRGFYASSPTMPQILYVMEALRLGIGFAPPCINRSRERFSVETSSPKPQVSGLKPQASTPKPHTLVGRALPADANGTPPIPCTVQGEGDDHGRHCRARPGLQNASPASNRNGSSTPNATDDAPQDASPKPQVSSLKPQAPSLKPLAFIRLPVSHINGLSQALIERHLAQRENGPFTSLADFVARCRPGEADAQLLLDSGALDCFGMSRPEMFWQLRGRLRRDEAGGEMLWDAVESRDVAFGGATDMAPAMRAAATASTTHAAAPVRIAPTVPATATDTRVHAAPPVELTTPDAWQVANREMELLGFPITIDPLTLLGRDAKGQTIDWSRYTPVCELGEHLNRRVRVCGLMVADRINATTGGELMKFVTLADRTGFIETHLFPDVYRRFGHLTVANPILEAIGMVEPFENRNGFTLRVLSVSPPRKS